MPDAPESESRKGIPNGKSKHYGDLDARFKIDADPVDALARLVADTAD